MDVWARFLFFFVMTEILIYILISYSYVAGTATVIDRFASEHECLAAKNKIPEIKLRGIIGTHQQQSVCLKAKVVRGNYVDN